MKTTLNIKFENVLILFILNPFIFSGVVPIGSDVSIFYLSSILIIGASRLPVIIPIIILFALVDITTSLHLFVFFLITKGKFPSITKNDLKFFLLVSYLFLLIQLVNPELYDLFFYRNLVSDSSRGYSSFGPEPATSALILISMLFCFEHVMDKRMKWLFAILSLMTFNMISLIGLVLYFLHQKKSHIITLAIITGVSVYLLSPLISDLRIFKITQLVYENKFQNIVEADRSLSARYNAIRVPIAMLSNQDFFGFDYSNIYVGKGLNSVNLIVPAGIFAKIQHLGILSLFIFFYFMSKIKDLKNTLVLMFFIFVGSMGHPFPMFYLLQGNNLKKEF